MVVNTWTKIFFCVDLFVWMDYLCINKKRPCFGQFVMKNISNYIGFGKTAEAVNFALTNQYPGAEKISALYNETAKKRRLDLVWWDDTQMAVGHINQYLLAYEGGRVAHLFKFFLTFGLDGVRLIVSFLKWQGHDVLNNVALPHDSVKAFAEGRMASTDLWLQMSRFLYGVQNLVKEDGLLPVGVATKIAFEGAVAKQGRYDKLCRILDIRDKIHKCVDFTIDDKIFIINKNFYGEWCALADDLKKWAVSLPSTPVVIVFDDNDTETI